MWELNEQAQTFTEKCEIVRPREAEDWEWSLLLTQNWGAVKAKGFLGKYFLWETMEAITHFKVSSYWHWEPKTDCKKYRNSQSKTVVVLIWEELPYWAKKTWELSWTEQEVNTTHCQHGTQVKKDHTICPSQSISNICAHYQRDVFHVKEPLGQEGALEVIKNVFTFYRAIDALMSQELTVKACSGYFPYQ